MRWVVTVPASVVHKEKVTTEEAHEYGDASVPKHTLEVAAYRVHFSSGSPLLMEPDGLIGEVALGNIVHIVPLYELVEVDR